VGAPDRGRRDGDICGHARAGELTADAAEIIPIEKIGVAAFADGENQFPGPARGRNVERDRCGSAEIKVAMIEVAPV
jgi:hypothetical protein